MKKFLSFGIARVIAAAVFLGLTSCGSYYYPTGGEVWVENVNADTAYSFTDRIMFEIKWENVSGNHIDPWLITPLGGFIADGGPEIDGCYFLGTYEEGYYQYVSQIECLDSPWGTYDLHIENDGIYTETTTTEITWEHNSGWDITNSFFKEDSFIGGGDKVVISYDY